jgi:hypothetical protein
MAEELILKQLRKLEVKVDKIETTMAQISVQTERLNNISAQINALWKKYDAAFAPDGVVTEIKNFQASCPRDHIRATLSRQDMMIKIQWSVIGLLVLLVSSKAIGIF